MTTTPTQGEQNGQGDDMQQIDELAQKIIVGYLADDIAYLAYGKKYEALELTQKSTLVHGTVKLATKIASDQVAAIQSQLDAARKKCCMQNCAIQGDPLWIDCVLIEGHEGPHSWQLYTQAQVDAAYQRGREDEEKGVDWQSKTRLWSSTSSLERKLGEFAHRYVDAENAEERQYFTQGMMDAIDEAKTCEEAKRHG